MNAEQRQNQSAAAKTGSLIVELIDAAIALRNGERAQALATLRHARLALDTAIDIIGE